MAIIKNDKEALTHALILGITAPEDKLEEVAHIAQEIAYRLSDKEIEQCKKDAMLWIDEQERKANEQGGIVIH